MEASRVRLDADPRRDRASSRIGSTTARTSIGCNSSDSDCRAMDLRLPAPSRAKWSERPCGCSMRPRSRTVSTCNRCSCVKSRIVPSIAVSGVARSRNMVATRRSSSSRASCSRRAAAVTAFARASTQPVDQPPDYHRNDEEQTQVHRIATPVIAPRPGGAKGCPQCRLKPHWQQQAGTASNCCCATTRITIKCSNTNAGSAIQFADNRDDDDRSTVDMA